MMKFEDLRSVSRSTYSALGTVEIQSYYSPLQLTSGIGYNKDVRDLIFQDKKAFYIIFYFEHIIFSPGAGNLNLHQ